MSSRVSIVVYIYILNMTYVVSMFEASVPRSSTARISSIVPGCI